MIPSYQSKRNQSLKLFDRGVRIFVLVIYLLSIVGLPTLAVHAGVTAQVEDIKPETDRLNGYFLYLPIIMGGSGTMPTDINLSDNTIEENQPVDTVVGTLSTVDPGVGDSHTYSLVAGVGDDDNASFNILDDQLRSSEEFNYEVKNSYSIRIQTMDQDGLTYQESFTIEVLDVDDLPVADDQTVSTVQNRSVDITLTGSDEDGDLLLFWLLSLPNQGTLFEDGDPLERVTIPPGGFPIPVSPDLVYEPDEDFTGDDSFDFQISANNALSETATVSIVVAPILEIDIDHEEGILSGDWESDNGGGYVGVSADAALAGTNYGLWADSGEGTSQYAYLNFPPVDNDTMRLRFYIDVQNVIPDTGYMHIVGVKSSNQQENICYIRLRYTGTQYYIQFDAKEDGDVDYQLKSTAGSISASDENYVEVMIVRAGSGQSNGEAYLWVNGILEGSAIDLDNDQQFTNLGFIEAGVFAKSGTWSGNFYIDEIMMNNTGDLIGPLGQ